MVVVYDFPMLSRRKFFSIMPLSVLGFAATAKSEVSAVKNEESIPLWEEMTCQRPGNELYPACGQRFKFVHGTYPYCPKCGCLQNMHSSEENRRKLTGVPC